MIRLTPKLSEVGELHLRVLAELDAFVRRSGDVCLARELVRDELPGSNSDSEGDASVANCGGFGHFPHVPNSPLRWRCIQIVHDVDDFCFQWVPLRSDSGVGDIEILQKRQHQDWVTHNVTIVHVPLICQASVFLQRVLRVVGTGELFLAAKLEVGSFLHSGCVVCLQSLFF